ncbi:MATE family efflux transporter [Clostridiales bacterium COT073_COT-073]|nr:MATE family efflux transporter [Clostridiales bacterium COT073_COT-073]
MKDKRKEILEGDISKGLIWLALPIMGTSFLEMAYNLTDMFWIGRLSSREVAAVGTAGFFPWLMMGLITIPRIGAEVMIAQSVGRQEESERRAYIATVLQMGVLLGILYSIFIWQNSNWLLGFFRIKEAEVVAMADDYLRIVVFGMVFAFLNPIFTGILNAHGQSGLPFRFNTTGLIINIILDPILIFGFFGLPAMGVKGAAYATVIAQISVSLLFIMFMIKDRSEFSGIPFRRLFLDKWKKVAMTGAPTAVQGLLFTLISMVLARIVTSWGAAAIAVQKVTAQIEAISWRSAYGFSTALTTYVGQNYGAGNKERVKLSYQSAMKMGMGIGIFATGLLLFFPRILLAPFFHEAEVLEMGVQCMRIMGVSQMFMVTEIITSGAFNGLGKTVPPSINGIVFTALRIPMAWYFSGLIGLDGVWWSVALSSVCKGIVLPGYYYFGLYRRLN